MAIAPVQKRSLQEWPGGREGQKSLFFVCLFILEYWIRQFEAIHRKLFFIYCSKGQVEEDSYILKAKLHQRDTPPHLKPTAPFSSHPGVEFFPAYNPSYDASCALTEKKPSLSTFQNGLKRKKNLHWHLNLLNLYQTMKITIDATRLHKYYWV